MAHTQPARTAPSGNGRPADAAARPIELDAAERVEALRAAFATGRTRSLQWRREQLAGLERLLAQCEAEILGVLREDLGKPRLEAFAAEIAYLRREAAFVRKHLSRWMRPTKVPTGALNQPGRSEIRAEPLGAVLIIAPWNYPLTLSLQPLMGAVAAGNTALLKPSEVAPATSSLLAERLPEYLDPTCVQVVEGGVPETTALLEQCWDHIFYTGNGRVGRLVMTAAAKHLTPVTLELGGKSPCLVDDTAKLQVAARRIAFGKWFNAGQTCVAPDYLLVHERVADELLERLAETLQRFHGPDPRQSPDYGRIVNQRHHDRLMALMDSGRVLVGGQADRASRYIAPTILTDVPADSPVMAEEIFGPILPVLRVGSLDEAIRFVCARPKPLALYLFSESKQAQEQVLRRTSSGGVTLNHTWMHLGVRALPFGGVGESGMGRYHGRASFDCFSNPKAVLYRSTAIDPELLYPPYGPIKQRLLEPLL